MARTLISGKHAGRETKTSREVEDVEQNGADDEETSTSGGPFPFINVAQNLKINRSERSTIRTQVMQDFYRKARQPGSHYHGAHVLPMGEIAAGPGGQMKRFRLAPGGLQDLKKPRKQKVPFGKASNPFVEQQPSSPSRKKDRDAKIFPGDDIPDRSTREDPRANAFDGIDGQDFIPKVLAASGDGTQGLWYLPQLKILDYFGGALDPFDSMPGPSLGRKAMLIHYYFQNRLTASWLMIPVRKSFFVAAIQDLAWFYSALAHYSGTYQLNFGQGDSAEALLLRTQSIEVVNERLGKPGEEISDSTIGAVASMIVYEAYNGSIQALETHVRGLKRMIDMRGGLEKANISEPVLRLIAWGDVIASCHLCHLAGLVPALENLQDPIACPFPNITAATHAPPFNPFVISRSFPNLLGITRNLVAILHANIENPITVNSSDHLGYSDYVYLVSRSLVFLCLDPKTVLKPLERAACMALVLFVDTYLRDITFYALITRMNVPRLKTAVQSAMEDTPAILASPADAQTLLWAMWFGGIAAIAKPEREWFVARLARLCDLLGLYAWEDVERILEGMLWDPNWEIGPGTLWSEVQQQMATKRG